MGPVELYAVQPYMEATDYFEASRFYAKMYALADQAHRMRRSPDRPAILAFPEDIGTFLALVGRGEAVKRAQSVADAFGQVGRRLLLPVLAARLLGRAASLQEALWMAAAPEVWRIWQGTMADLARRFRMTVVAGSALMPVNARGWDDVRFSARNGRTYNLSVTFGPDGHVLSYTRKVNLVPGQEDHLGLTPGPRNDAVKVVKLPGEPSLGLATAICYDAFTVPHTPDEPAFHSLIDDIDAAGTAILAQPSANPWRWEEPWPLEVSGRGRTRREQWREETAPHVLARARHLRAVVNPHLLMRLWDLEFDGQSAIWLRTGDGVKLAAEAPGWRAEARSETVLHAVWEPAS